VTKPRGCVVIGARGGTSEQVPDGSNMDSECVTLWRRFHDLEGDLEYTNTLDLRDHA